MVKLDAVRTSVATAVRAVASSTPRGGHTRAEERSVKYAANRPAKNISSDASHTITPTDRGDGPLRPPVASPDAGGAAVGSGAPTTPVTARSLPPGRTGRPHVG